MVSEPPNPEPAQAIPGRRNTYRASLALLAAVGYSFMPLAIVLSGGYDYPFLFGAFWRAGIAATYCLLLAAVFPELFFNPGVWRLVRRRLFSQHILIIMIAYFDIALFAMSIRYLGASVAIILMALSPVLTLLFIWATHRVFTHGGESGESSPSTIFFMLIGLTGIAFFILGLEGQQGTSTAATGWFLILGLLLAIGSATVSGLNVSHSVAWSGELAGSLTDAGIAGEGYADDRINLFCITAAGIIATLGLTPILMLIGAGFGEFNAVNSQQPIGVGGITVHPLVFVVGAAVLTHAVAGIFLRIAHIRRDEVSLLAIDHVRPVLSLLWLLPFGFLAVSRADYLIIGAAALLTGNLLIAFEAEIHRSGFKALVVSLGTCGAIVYLRDDVFTAVGLGRSDWVIGGYFEWVALCATIFTLLLAFRVASLVSRTNAEESHAFSIFRRLDMLAQRNVIDGDIRECIVRIDAPRNQAELESSYGEARDFIIGVCPLAEADRQTLASVEAELDTLVRSKQLGLVLGELFALVIFAGITAGIALLLRPDHEHIFSGWLTDIFSMLISAVVIFLTINVWDLYHERKERQLEVRPDRGDYVVRFPDTEHGLFDQWFSIVIGIGILLTYAGLLAHKWMGWFGWLG